MEKIRVTLIEIEGMSEIYEDFYKFTFDIDNSRETAYGFGDLAKEFNFDDLELPIELYIKPIPPNSLYEPEMKKLFHSVVDKFHPIPKNHFIAWFEEKKVFSIIYRELYHE